MDQCSSVLADRTSGASAGVAGDVVDAGLVGVDVHDRTCDRGEADTAAESSSSISFSSSSVDVGSW